MSRTLAAIVLLAAACSSSAPVVHPGPRGMRVDDHVDAAREHARRAAELARWPETRPGGPSLIDFPSTGLWYRRFETAREEERFAASHRSAAAQLVADYEAACGAAELAEVAASPLQRYAIGGENTATGVIVFLDPSAGPADHLLAQIRCHRAWMMLGERGMDDCPLDLGKLQIVAHGDAAGISVELSTTDAALVPELQRRAAHELEHATSHPHEARVP